MAHAADELDYHFLDVAVTTLVFERGPVSTSFFFGAAASLIRRTESHHAPVRVL